MGGLVHLVQRGGDWAGPHVICNATDVTARAPINSQCTNHNHRIVVFWFAYLVYIYTDEFLGFGIG